MIPVEAVEAAAKVAAKDGAEPNWYLETERFRDAWRIRMRAALEAAAPHMLSNEREQTRLAHLDAMVNRETAARLERAIAGVLELAAPMRHMVSTDEIRSAITNALDPTP